MFGGQAFCEDVCLIDLRWDMVQQDNPMVPLLSEIPGSDVEMFGTRMVVWMLCQENCPHVVVQEW